MRDSDKVIYIESKFNISELTESWDKNTSIARYAGCDELFDMIFVAKRDGNSVMLKKKPKSINDPFSSFFVGKLTAKENGSAISGKLRKSLFDYIVIAVFTFFVFVIANALRNAGNTLAAGIAVMLCLCFDWLALRHPKSKRIMYIEFINEICGNKDLNEYQ